MRKFIFVLLTLLLVSPFSFAMKGIIWQPQNRDSQVTDTQWQGLMSQLRLQGFDTLVLQWTRYGDAFTQPEQRALLFKRAAAAQQAGLKLIRNFLCTRNSHPRRWKAILIACWLPISSKPDYGAPYLA